MTGALVRRIHGL